MTRRFPPGPLSASPAAPAPESVPAAAAGRRAALAAAVLLAVAAAHFAAAGEASARAVAADPELAGLLRAMAFLKASMAGAAVWLVERLLRQGLPAASAAGLVLAAALMAAGPVLMWHVARVGAGAVLFHAGLVLLLVLGWRPAEAWLARRSRAGGR